jgi:chemotaxis protein MotB
MRRRRQDGHSNHDRWLVSYADFITLLFAFFVVLYATSKADLRKQAQLAQALHSAFSAFGLVPDNGHGQGAASAPVIDDPHDPDRISSDLERIRGQLQQKLSKEIAARALTLQVGRDGLVISLREAGFFESGSALPQSASLGAIGVIAKQLAITPYDLRIEGHTDDVPIHNTQFATNWELSTARATQIARIFIEDYQIAPPRLSASGYAEYHPIASNATAEGRAQNRRVDIIVLPRLSAPSPGPAPPNALAWTQLPPNHH